MDDKHPANGQYGLVARVHLPADSFILPYIGKVHLNDPSDTDDSSDYDLSLDRDLGLSIDAAQAGNEARFINDYRGIAAGPNAEFRDCWVRMPESAPRRWERRTAIFVLPAGRSGKRGGGIRAGEEIVVNYGRGFWKERGGAASTTAHPSVAHSAPP